MRARGNRRPSTASRWAIAATAVVVAGSLAPLGASSASVDRPAAAGRSLEATGDVIELPSLGTSPDRRIVDAEGRDVLLRGANVNTLGEYWQGVPSVPTTMPITDADWEEMAAHGFSVIRLLVTWSKVEPTRDSYDQAYLDQVSDMVDAAAAHGIYSVIDMHQDAYTPFLFTTDPSTCTGGTTPAKGWDGAPAWAVKSDGLSTCLAGSDRNSSPAVNRAWNNFYDNVDGLRDEYAEMWGVVAARFKGRPEVAGYDLMNEPETSRPEGELKPKYQALLASTIKAIRTAEDSAAFDHIVFIEPTVPAGTPSNGIVIPDPKGSGVSIANVSASVHNYSESIGGGSIEGLNDGIEQITKGIGVPNWGGEYGFWDTSASTLEKAHRYAADEDAHLWGGAWWQWRQSCGDPHAVQWENGSVVIPTHTSTHLNALACPGNTDLGPTDEFLEVVGRGYPRATPGRLVEVRSDIGSGFLKVKANATKAGGQLVVWTPTADDADHEINVFGLTDVKAHDVEGGRIITATVSVTGVYALWVGEPDEDLSKSSTTTTTTPGTAPPATPVDGNASFTG